MKENMKQTASKMLTKIITDVAICVKNIAKDAVVEVIDKGIKDHRASQKPTTTITKKKSTTRRKVVSSRKSNENKNNQV
jgi:hypothetical protein